MVALGNAFPDPSNYPAFHTRTLIVNHRRGSPRTIPFVLRRRPFIPTHSPGGWIPHFPHSPMNSHHFSNYSIHAPHTPIQRPPEPIQGNWEENNGNSHLRAGTDPLQLASLSRQFLRRYGCNLFIWEAAARIESHSSITYHPSPPPRRRP